MGMYNSNENDGVGPAGDKIQIRKGSAMGFLTLSETCLFFNLGAVVKNSQCLSIMNQLQSINQSHLRLRLVAIAATQDSASCSKYAAENGIQVYDDYRQLLAVEHLNLILDLTGDPLILSDIVKHKRPSVGVLDREAFTQLLDIADLYSWVDRHQSEFATTLLGASPDAVLVVDNELRILDGNRSPLIAGGANIESLIGRSCAEAIHGSSSDCHDTSKNCPARKTQKTGKTSRTMYEVIGSDGKPQIVQTTAYPIFNRFGDVAQIVLTIRDMTEDLVDRIEQRTQVIRKDLARVVQEDRLASLGRLVASVCHEINNPITSIATFTKLVSVIFQRPDLSDEDLKKIDHYLDISFREALRCGIIVKNLLTFARPKSLEAKIVDLNEIVHTILALANHQMELANIRCKTDLPGAAFTAWGDYAKIQQCLLNLILNAIDAMPDGGTITISGKRNEPSDFVWLEVSDTGHGIDPMDLPRIFEPFYSTKIDGKGVGLGLSMVHGIVREHGGAVEVDSEPDKGTTFIIKLPRKPIKDCEGERDS
jgi:two-component system, NtrC family, sensor kinase